MANSPTHGGHLRGQVVFFRVDKRYGYLRLPDTKEEFYFRPASEDDHAYVAGEWVYFRIRQHKRGVDAVEVAPAGLV